jgi:hypothetical protein
VQAGSGNKLRKNPRRLADGGDGYESEGYLSEGGKKKKDMKKEKSMRKKEMKKEKSMKKMKEKEFGEQVEFKRAPTLEADAESIFESLPKAKFAKSKSIKSATSTPKKSKRVSPPGSSPPPSPSLSPKRPKPTKSLSFFRLTHKQSKEKMRDVTEEKDREIPPPVPSMPAPIFEKFSRTASPMPGTSPSIMSFGNAPSNSHTLDADRKSQESTGSGTGMTGQSKFTFDFYGDSPSTTTNGSESTTAAATAPVHPRIGLSISTDDNSYNSLSPTPSSDRSLTPSSYVVVTPASSAVNLPSDTVANPSLNPLQKLIKHIPTPLSISTHSPPAPAYSISHPNTNPNSRTASPAPLSSTSYAFVSAPNNTPVTDIHSHTLAPPKPLRRRSLLSVVPSPDDDGNLVPPNNVLAYYDVPPPSPPPTCPLPRPPRTRGGSDESISQIQRGREAPFPKRPVQTDHLRPAAEGLLNGFEGRVKVNRYRDLYGWPPEGNDGNQRHVDPVPVVRNNVGRNKEADEVRQARRRGGFIGDMSPPISAENDAGEDDDDDDEGQQGYGALENILSRYADLDNEESDDESHYAPSDRVSYLAGRRSTISLDRPSFDRRSMDFDDEDPEPKRYSRFNESAYSLHSIMDDEKSGSARDRFVRRVQALYGSDGRENEVPPVPKLPVGYRVQGIGRGGRI